MKKIVLTLALSIFSLLAFSEADYVYHEASTNTIGLTSLQFRDIMTPNRTQSVKIGFKIEFQFYWNQARIYYTTDGSNPSGSFGIGNGTTQVINAVFDHNFGSPLVDAVFGIIPAQPAGTTVKYIVSAWFNGGGDEIFGNGCGNAPRTFCASDNKISSQATIFQYIVSATARKIFTLDPNPAVSLAGSNGSCTTPGTGQPNVFNVSVSGVGTMSNVNQLLLTSIGLSDCGTGSKNLNSIQIRILSPSGQCFGIYNGGLSTIATGTHFLNLVSATTCLNNPNTANEPNTGSPFTSSGNNGYYNAQFGGTPTNYSNFTGSADGTWKIIFSESTSSPPCVDIIRLFFGDPNVINQGTSGDNCSNPIVWDGSSPICGATTSMSGSTQMPGSIGGPNTNSFGTIGGATCGWNFANNNDVWIKYVAKKDNTCMSISGISGTSVSLQSIVVTDANTNDSDPCTQIPRSSTNDPNWQVVSCPRPSIYGTTAGSQYNQQHCFTSQIGKTYYLVVDGDGGANSKFWIWGFDFNGVLDLNDSKETLNIRKEKQTSVVFKNGILTTEIKNSLTEYQNIIIYDASGKSVYKTSMFVKGLLKIDLNKYLSSGVNIVNVLIDNKTYDKFIFKVLK
jgi:hypothetical protein